MATDLKYYFKLMLYDLLGNSLEVIKVPSAIESCANDGGGCRVVVSRNPKWYRELCARFPKNRLNKGPKGKSKPRYRHKRYVDSRVYRSDIIPLLERLVEGKESKSQYVPYLTDTAEDFKKVYKEQDVMFYLEHGDFPEPFTDQF